MFCFVVANVLAQVPEMVVQSGHSEQLWTVAMSSDNKYIVTGAWDNSAKLWDVQTGKQLRSFNGHDGYIMSVNLSDDNKFLLTSSNDKTLKIWDMYNGSLLKTLPVNAHPRSAKFAGNGKLIHVSLAEVVNGNIGPKAVIFDANTAKEIRSVDVSAAYGITSAISKDGKILATLDPMYGERYHQKGSISIWDVKTGAKIRTFAQGYEKLNNIAINADGKYVVVQQDSSILLWDVYSGIFLKSFNTYSQYLNSVTISDDGQCVVLGNSKGTIMKLDVSSKKNTLFFKKGIVGCNSVFISGDNKLIVSGHGRYGTHGCNEFQNMAILWNAKNGEELRTFTGIATGVMAIAMNTDGRYIASACSDTTIRLWDAKLGKQTKIFTGHAMDMECIAISSCGRFIVSGSKDNTAKLWDAERGKELWSVNGAFTEERSHVPVIDISGDGRYFLTGNASNHSDDMGLAILWDTQLKTKVASYEAKCQTTGVALSMDGNYAAISGWSIKGSIIRVWEVKTGIEILTIPLGSDMAGSVSLNHNGSLLSFSQFKLDNSYVTLYDVKEKKELKKMNGDHQMSMSNDGQYFVCGGMNASALLIEANTGSQLKVFNELRGANKTKPIVISGDGKRIALISDGYIKYWSREKNQDICTFVSLVDGEWATITPDKDYFTSRGANKGISFVEGFDFFTFDNFDLIKNRPDLVLEQIGIAEPNLIKAYKNAYIKRLKRMGLNENDIASDTRLPQVEILNKDIPIETQNRKLTLKLNCFDKKNKLDRINVYVNDVAVFGRNGIDLKGKKTKSLELDVEIELSAGLNNIQVSVLNQKALESLRKSVYVNCNGQTVKPDIYILAIGISKYNDSRFNLTYAAKDAIDLAAAFQSKSNGFNQVNSLIITDEKATRENIIKAKEFLLKAKVDDEVIVSFAGHGLLDSKLDYFLATTDIDFENPSVSGLAYNDLENLLDSVQSRKKVLFIDACNSGEVDKEESIIAEASAEIQNGTVKSRGFKSLASNNGIGLQNSFELMQELFSEVRKGSGAFVISSASGTEFSLESDKWKNGVFTYSIIDGIQTGDADKNGDGKIRVTELRDYVTSKVLSLTGGLQTPGSRKENLDNDFVVFYSNSQ